MTLLAVGIRAVAGRGAADCARLAAFFWIGWEGAVLRAKLDRSAEPLRVFADCFRATVKV